MGLDITYERSVNKSFMKIPALPTPCLDEKLIFYKEYRGTLPVEKCYVNGEGQYWYNITGKQALDTYCKIHGVEQNFFEMLMLRICSQLEILDWNLITPACLIMEPEMIFINHDGDEVLFVLYPNPNGDFFENLQKLMEYLLTKLNHENREGLKQIYNIYEMCLNKTFRIEDIKQELLSEKKENIISEQEEEIDTSVQVVERKESLEMESKITEWLSQLKRWILNMIKSKEETPMVVYPDEIEEEIERTVNPTICLTATFKEPMGQLLYEGVEDFPDFQLGKEVSILGKNKRVKLYLDKETISQFHAKIDYLEGCYYIEDLNSTNGTFVNDEMLNYKEKKELVPGDLIRFADVKYRFL